MRQGARVLLLLTIPGLVFGSLTRVPKPEFDAVDPGHAVHEPWLDALIGLALAAAIIAAAGIALGALHLLRSHWDRRRLDDAAPSPARGK